MLHKNADTIPEVEDKIKTLTQNIGNENSKSDPNSLGKRQRSYTLSPHFSQRFSIANIQKFGRRVRSKTISMGTLKLFNDPMSNTDESGKRVILTGYQFKKHHITGRWQKMWFVLREDKLMYFKKKEV